jgi:thioredoxin-like negative regulator of GroEL
MITALALDLLLLGPTPAAAIKWERSFDEAIKKAQRSGKPVIVDFWADWCTWCHRLDRTTYADPAVVKKSQEFVAVRVNTEGSRREVEVAIRYGVASLPTIVFLSPQCRQVRRLNGFQGPGQFPHTLEAALQSARRVMEWEETLERNPDDPGALASLGTHLFEQEAYDEAREMLYRAVGHDADAPVGDRRRVRMLLAILQNYDHNFAEAENLIKDALSLQPKGDDEPKLLFVLGRTYVSWGRHAEGVRTMEVIVREYPHSPLAQKARETLVTLERK